jgi:acyl-CoA reductase-like NAD-dependent aldehyde dehydrogenase
MKIATLMERDLDALASLETLDNGKAFSAAKGFDVSSRALLDHICTHRSVLGRAVFADE